MEKKFKLELHLSNGIKVIQNSERINFTEGQIISTKSEIVNGFFFVEKIKTKEKTVVLKEVIFVEPEKTIPFMCCP